MKNIIVITLSLVLIYSCNQNDQQLSYALKYSESNRSELERVISHYSENLSDSLKLRATHFLIANMPGHYGVDINDIKKRDRLIIPILNDTTQSAEIKRMKIDSILRPLGAIRIIEDIKVITAEYLIHNIDKAFDYWNAPLAKHLDFNQFCEYILPYRIINGQPIEYWKDSLAGCFGADPKSFKHCDYFKDIVSVYSKYIHQKIVDSLEINILANSIHINGYKFWSASTMCRIPYGVCMDYAVIGAALMNSKGIPISIDFTPQWMNLPLGHTWNMLLLDYGIPVPYGGIADSAPGTLPYTRDTKSKVFRHSYAINHELVELNKVESNDVPSEFKNYFIKDVTDEYMKVANIRVPIKTNLKHKYGYLAVVNKRGWNPVAYGKRKGSEVFFEKIGVNNVYLPVFHDNGSIISINYPFMLNTEGRLQYFIPDTLNLQSVKLRRKYYNKENIYNAACRMIGGKIQASNDSDFNNAITIYEVPEYAPACMIDIDSSYTYRYWRYLSAPGSHCFIAEMMFFDRLDQYKMVKGKIIGTAGSFANDESKTKESMFDGDHLTHYDAADNTGGWAGMDFGGPISLSRIGLYPASDGNNIEIGDLYELMYYGLNGWHSLGTQVANDIELTFKAPSNALFLLKNLSRGSEEHIFSYENGCQIWK